MKKNKNTYIHTIKDSLDGKITVADAAIKLGISTRQVIRMRKGFKAEGRSFFTHKNQGRKPANAMEKTYRNKISELYASEKYKDSTFLQFIKRLEQEEGLQTSYRTVHRILTDMGKRSPSKQGRKRKKQTPPVADNHPWKLESDKHNHAPSPYSDTDVMDILREIFLVDDLAEYNFTKYT